MTKPSRRSSCGFLPRTSQFRYRQGITTCLFCPAKTAIELKRSTATRRTRLRETNGLPFSVDKALRYTRRVQTAVLVVCLIPSLRYEKLIRH